MDASPSESKSKPGEDCDAEGGGQEETMCIISQEANNAATTGGSSISDVPHEPGDGSPTGASPSSVVVVAEEASPLPMPTSSVVAVFAVPVAAAANMTESVSVKEVEIGPGITLGFHSHTEYSFIIATVPKVVDDLP